mmetsp:Transcript_16343/g.38943  ORF Transcript_16343/g.38943 Transcript_16343/m.38943 type:complete len:324 (-) Transcript_16343:3752-4723(-)
MGGGRHRRRQAPREGGARLPEGGVRRGARREAHAAPAQRRGGQGARHPRRERVDGADPEARRPRHLPDVRRGRRREGARGGARGEAAARPDDHGHHARGGRRQGQDGREQERGRLRCRLRRQGHRAHQPAFRALRPGACRPPPPGRLLVARRLPRQRRADGLCDGQRRALQDDAPLRGAAPRLLGARAVLRPVGWRHGDAGAQGALQEPGRADHPARRGRRAGRSAPHHAEPRALASAGRQLGHARCHAARGGAARERHLLGARRQRLQRLPALARDPGQGRAADDGGRGAHGLHRAQGAPRLPHGGGRGGEALRRRHAQRGR